MRSPISYVYGNCVFARGLDDRWAAFTLEPSSYAWLGEEAKHARLLALVGALESIEADVQLVRVSRRWEVARYAGDLADAHESRSAGAARHTRAVRRYLAEHAARLAEVGGMRPFLFVIVSLSEPERDIASYVSRAAGEHPRAWVEWMRRAASVHERRMLTRAELERARAQADQVHARLVHFLPVRPARGDRAAVAHPTLVLPRAGRSVARWRCTIRARSSSSATAKPRSRRSRATCSAGPRASWNITLACSRSSPSSAPVGRHCSCSGRCPSAWRFPAPAPS